MQRLTRFWRRFVAYLIDGQFGQIGMIVRMIANRVALIGDPLDDLRKLLRAGADPRLANDHGSTPSDLAPWTTGRGGVGSQAAKTEQQIIIDLLKRATG